MTYDEKTRLVAQIATTLISNSEFFDNNNEIIEDGVNFALAIVNKAEERVHNPKSQEIINLNEGNK